MLELLVQKCILTCNPEFSQPGDLFRRVMECAASGVFLPGKDTQPSCSFSMYWISLQAVAYVVNYNDSCFN